MTRSCSLIALLAVTTLSASFVFAGAVPAQTTTASPKLPNKIAIAERNAKQLMLLMDADKNGRVSKAEWMKFMSDEFDHLDSDKSGSLDLKELEKSNLTVAHVSPEVQGK
jgi:hypothetical protein